MKNKRNLTYIKYNELLEVSKKLWGKSIQKYEKDFEKLYKDAMKYRRYHSKLVADIALEIFDQITKESYYDKKDYERKILYFSCLVHDIKKFDNNHNVEGAKWVKKNIKKYLNIKDNPINNICVLIKSHKLDSGIKKDIKKYSCKLTKDNMKRLILIVRMSDKLSKLKEKSIYSEISYREIKKELKKVCENSKRCISRKYEKDIESYLQKLDIQSILFRYLNQ